MPKQKRYRTDYPGVYYIKGKMVSTGKPEKIFYIMYRKNGKQIHEKAGRQFKDNMAPAKAANFVTFSYKHCPDHPTDKSVAL